jgi:nitrogen fixation/metabolism regulation signal transduction histidine kinase
MALLGGLPAVLVALVLIWTRSMRTSLSLTLTVIVVASWLGTALALRGRVVRSLQTLSNLVAALREGDYSIRARGADPASPLGLTYQELNKLADALRQQRLDATEAVGLLRHVMEEIDIAILAFDPEGRLALVNRGGEALLGRPSERALGLDAAALGLAETLTGPVPRLFDFAATGRAGRWEIRRATYRWEGRPHQLVVLSDLTRALREEERGAWQRLVRVLSHEINNSLAPIKSIAGSLRNAFERRGTDAKSDLEEGLGVIESRAEGLGRFLQAYARLATLPKPRLRPLEVAAWVRCVVTLETRIPVVVEGGPEVTIAADADQLDSLLINLLRNAADAAIETQGAARVRWRIERDWLALEVEDDGPGLGDTANLFVPFFTTKPSGTGIGLSLCRQIAEAHGGTIALENRRGARGAVASVRLPVAGG